MTPVAELLTQSRAAHQAARTRTGDEAAAQWRTALELRLEARRLDPNRFDGAWLEDAVHPKLKGDTKRRYHRIPGKTPAQVAFDKDVELVAFFMAKLAEQAAEPPRPLSVDEMKALVVVPDRWQLVTTGETPCATCGHTKVMHTVVGQPKGSGPCHSASADAFHNIVPCECATYSAAECRHAWVLDAPTRRHCVGCDEVHQLVPKMAVEDTEAFKQLQQERGR